MADESDVRRALLKQHPGWADLRSHFEAERDKAIISFGRQVVMVGKPVSAEDAARAQGRWKGVFELLNNPTRAESTLRRENETEE